MMKDEKQLFKDKKFEEIIRIHKNGTYSTYLAYSFQKTKQWEKAMEVWNALIAKSPNEASLYNERGVCKFNLKFKHAIQDFEKAIELEPENAYFYSCRAYIKDKMGDTEGSIADYTQALVLDPDDAITLNNLGLAEQKLGFTASARKRFKYSDDLLGIKTIDSREEFRQEMAEEKRPAKTTLWQEFKKMWSRKGFVDFLRELKR